VDISEIHSRLVANPYLIDIAHFISSWLGIISRRFVGVAIFGWLSSIASTLEGKLPQDDISD
jgi:hypothetical protein